MSLARQVASNTAIQFAGKALSTVLGLATVALIQRALKPEGYGAYTIVMSYLGFASVIADLGLYVILTRELNKPGADRPRILANVLGIRLVSVAIVFTLALALLPLFHYGSGVGRGILIGTAAFLTVAVTQLLASVFQTALAMHKMVLAEFTGRVVLLIGVALAVTHGFGLSAIIVALVAANAVTALLNILQADRHVHVRVAFERSQWAYLLKETAPVALSVAFNLIYFRMDTIILSLYRSASEVGLYGAAYKILEILQTLPIMFVGLMLPILTHAFATDRSRFQALYQRAFDALVIGVVPLIVGGWLLADSLMVFIGGQEFAAAAPVFRLLLIAVGCLFLNTLSGHTVTILNQQRKMVWGYLSIAVIGVATYLVLIPMVGPKGAATGTIVTEALSAIIGSVLVFRAAAFRVSFKAVGKVLLVSAVMGGVLAAIPGERLWLEIPVAIAIYTTLIILTRTIPREFLREMLRRESPSPVEPSL